MKPLVPIIAFIAVLANSCASVDSGTAASSKENIQRETSMTYKGLKIWSGRPFTLTSQSMQGVAVKGYDMVTLFTDSKTVSGNPGFSASYLGATWHFIDEANRTAFSKSPERFMPEYGGYCSWSIANDSELPPSPGDPRAFDFVDGKLYFKYNKMVRFLWRFSSAKYIQKADARWPMFQDTIKSYVAETAGK
jgi:YHS domain-containing protein